MVLARASAGSRQMARRSHRIFGGECAKDGFEVGGRNTSMRLLIVEDESRIVEILRSGLGRAGFVIDAMHGYLDAREALACIHYDAVVLDLGLPDGDGLTLLA